MPSESFMIFTGTANTRLAVDVVNHLDMSLGRMTVGRFSDGEVMAEINENVRGKDVFVLQPTCAPTNDNLMEVMVMVDALRRASAGRITAAIPYFGYARQDRRPRSARVAITAKVVANMLQVAGIDRVLTMDLHADQIQGFFDIPVDNIYAGPILLGDIWRRNLSNLVVVSPDIGGVVRARALAKQLEAAALSDPYFVERKLYPNVDFYSGVIYKAIGFPAHMFTPLFAIGRLPGWIAHWREMMHDSSTKIGRPQQVYVGPAERNV